MFKPNNFKKGISVALALSMAFSNSSVMTIASSAGDTNTVSVDEGISVYDASEIEAVYNGELAVAGDATQDAENAGSPAKETNETSEAVADAAADTETAAETATTTEETTTQAATETVAAATETTANAEEEVPSETLSWSNETVKITAARTDGSSFPAGTVLEVFDYDGLSGDASAFISTFTEEELDLITDLHGFSIIYVTADGEEYDPGEVLYDISFTDAGFNDMIVKAYGYPVDMSSHEVINKADITVSESGVSASVTTSDKAFSLIASEEAEAVTAPVVTDAVENGSSDDVSVDETEALPVKEDTVPVVTDSVESDSSADALSDGMEALPVEEDAVRGQSSSDTAAVATGTAIAAAEVSPDDTVTVEEENVSALGNTTWFVANGVQYDLDTLSMSSKLYDGTNPAVLQTSLADAGYVYKTLNLSGTAYAQMTPSGSSYYSEVKGDGETRYMLCNTTLTNSLNSQIKSFFSKYAGNYTCPDLATSGTAHCSTGWSMDLGFDGVPKNFTSYTPQIRVVLYKKSGAKYWEKLRVVILFVTNESGVTTQDFIYSKEYTIEAPKGYLQLKKYSNTSSFDSIFSYYGINATYGIYTSAADAKAKNSNYVKTVTLTNMNGASASKTIALDTSVTETFYIAELNARSGSTSHNLSLGLGSSPSNNADSTGYVKVNVPTGSASQATIKALYDYGYYFTGLLLHKVDENNKPLQGAVFKVQFFSKDDSAKKNALKTWYVETDANGDLGWSYDFLITKKHLLSVWTDPDTKAVNKSDSLYCLTTAQQTAANSGNPTGGVALPRGYVTFQEVEAPEGYECDDMVYTRALNVEGGSSAYNTAAYKLTTNSLTVVNTPSSSGIRLKKSSTCPAVVNAFSSYSLAGAKYRIYSDEACTIQAKDLDGSAVADLVTNSDGITNTVSNLDFGKYYIKEIIAPAGHILNTSVIPVELTESNAGKVVTVYSTDQAKGDPGQIRILKTTEGTPEAVEGAIFRLDVYTSETSANPARTWYYKTDDNGTISNFSSTDDLVASYNGDSSDAFYTDSGGTVVFPIAKYTLQEVEAPSGYVRDTTVYTAHVSADASGNLKWTFDATGSKYLIFDAETNELSAVNPPAVPEIKTVAIDTNTEKHIGLASDNAVIQDTVYCTNLIIGKEYKLVASLKDSETGEEVAVTSDAYSFTARESSETHTVTINALTEDYEGRALVVCEELYRWVTDEEGNQYDEILVAEHKELKDVDQTIYYPGIKTLAQDSVTGTHFGSSCSSITVIDTVTYEGLLPGYNYHLYATLYDKETKEAVSGRATKSFYAESSSGTAQVSIPYKGEAGHDLVVFEELYVVFSDKGTFKVVEHKDINDEGQTVKYPKIGTTAKDASTGDNVGTVCTGAAIIDTVAYENLVPDQSYTLKGVLMDKDTGAELLVNGSNVTSEVSFTPEAKDGTVEVKFTFDASDLGGHSVVVFEQLYHNRVNVVSHEDFEDTEQTVVIPKIGTTAKDSVTGLDESCAEEQTITIVDTVAYENRQIISA